MTSSREVFSAIRKFELFPDIRMEESVQRLEVVEKTLHVLLECVTLILRSPPLTRVRVI